MTDPGSATGFQGYHRTAVPPEDPELTHTGPGTPCGEYLRRYWQPVCMSGELGELPLGVRLLGEDLVLFRDGDGRLGLLHRHCAHRGASLEYGVIAPRGIICCYHGWHYDIDGTLLRAGSEPEDAALRARVVQGAYPTHEHDGVIFAYLGPPEARPAFPLYDTQLIPDTGSRAFSLTTPCNWLQVYENTQDPVHVLHLHARSSGVQFGVASGIDQVVEYRDSPLGMFNVQTRCVGELLWTRTTESLFPNGNQTGAIWEEAREEKVFQRSAILRWMVPVDDTTTRTIGWRYFRPELDPDGLDRPDEVGKERIDFVGQTEDERSYEERQRQPGDFEAQVSQRPIAVHALEHRATSDRGVVKLRQMLRERVRELASGGSPAHPEPAPEGIPSYCQDTVVRWAGGGPVGDADLRAQGRRVAEVLLESASRPAKTRRDVIAAGCAEPGTA